MSERARQLQVTVDEQLDPLIEIISKADPSVLRRPCPGRAKLGDGTVGALAAHTAENYGRIATFVTGVDRVTAGNSGGGGDGHRIPRWARALGHRPPEHGPGMHDDDDGRYSAERATPRAVLEQLSAARGRLARLAELTDEQLDTVPPKDAFRFCDGQRTLEQVVAGLLKHQGRQVDALTAALTRP